MSEELRIENNVLVRDSLRLCEQLTTVTNERDHARRWVCVLLANPKSVMGLATPGNNTKQAFANEQHWDCCKEDRA